LELHNAQGTLIDSNDNWQTSPQKTQIQMQRSQLSMFPSLREFTLQLSMESGRRRPEPH